MEHDNNCKNRFLNCIIQFYQKNFVSPIVIQGGWFIIFQIFYQVKFGHYLMIRFYSLLILQAFLWILFIIGWFIEARRFKQTWVKLLSNLWRTFFSIAFVVIFQLYLFFCYQMR